MIADFLFEDRLNALAGYAGNDHHANVHEKE